MIMTNTYATQSVNIMYLFVMRKMAPSLSVSHPPDSDIRHIYLQNAALNHKRQVNCMLIRHCQYGHTRRDERTDLSKSGPLQK